MKKLFQKLRMDAKFARAGEGHKLTEDTRSYRPANVPAQPYVRTRPMTSSQAQAGAAALARHEERSKQTKTVKPSVGMGSRIRSQDSGNRPDTRETASTSSVDENNPNISNSSVENSIKFYSPFSDEIVAKSVLKHHMRENLVMRLSESPMEASSLMIQTLTTNQEKKTNALNTLHKYLDNMISNPDEEKYRKIRQKNRVFSEKVAPVEGAEEFLEAIGFQKTVEEEEIYFVLESVNVAKLQEAKEILSSAEALEFRLYRDPKIFVPTGAEPPRLSLPEEFYKLTSSEVKREQERRTDEVELNKQLRTKAMREAGKVNYTYNYAIIRIKFPDERLLQGTFRASETIDDIKSFIRQNINVQWAVFELKTSLGELLADDNATLLACKLAPAAVINLIWNEEIRLQILEEQRLHLGLLFPEDRAAQSS